MFPVTCFCIYFNKRIAFYAKYKIVDDKDTFVSSWKIVTSDK